MVTATMGDTAGQMQNANYTLRTWDSNNPGNVRTQPAVIAVDPGIPLADDQMLSVVTTTPVNVTLTGADPQSAAWSTQLRGSERSGGGCAERDATQSDLHCGWWFYRNGFVYLHRRGREIHFVGGDRDHRGRSDTISTKRGHDEYSGDWRKACSSVVSSLLCRHPIRTLAIRTTFTLVPGVGATDNARFTIVGNQLRAAVSFLGEVGNVFSISSAGG